MTQHEENCWIEAGLRSDGVELGVFEKGAIVHYGRLLTKDLVHVVACATKAGRDARSENFDLRLENSALRAMIEALKDQIQK